MINLIGLQVLNLYMIIDLPTSKLVNAEYIMLQKNAYTFLFEKQKMNIFWNFYFLPSQLYIVIIKLVFPQCLQNVEKVNLVNAQRILKFRIF